MSKFNIPDLVPADQTAAYQAVKYRAAWGRNVVTIAVFLSEEHPR